MNFNEKKKLAEQIAKEEAPSFVFDLLKEAGLFDVKQRGFEVLEDAHYYDYVTESMKPAQIPQRATKKSAGYDIRAVEEHFIKPGQMVAVPTGLTSYMQEDEFLDLRIRSGLAFKYQLTLQNDAGVIDADYYGKEIKVMIRNEGERVCRILPGDRIAQGIFINYLITDDDAPVTEDRTGGFGSTGVK
jgi:dUTP pyrophosphatase